MGFKSKAAVAVSGALTAGAFATLAAAVPASAATYGTEQSEGGVVFSVGNNGAIVGANQTGRNTEFSRSSQRGGGVTFSSSGRCVTDGRGGLRPADPHGHLGRPADLHEGTPSRPLPGQDDRHRGG